MLNLVKLLDETKCYATVRQLRWPEGVRCPKWTSEQVIKRGMDEAQVHCQRYQCQGCERQFDDLSETIFAAGHQPLRAWMSCLYLMGLNVSNQQIAQELDLSKDDVQQMTNQLRQAIVEKRPEVQLVGEVECDIKCQGHGGSRQLERRARAEQIASII